MLIVFGKYNYFKKDMIYKSGICPYCNKETTLSNFTTSQFYHVYYIPLIPLGKFHFVNYCNKCKKALSYKLDDWYSTSAEALEKAQMNYQHHKTQYNATIEMHMAYRTFGVPAEAFKFAEQMEQDFAGNAEVHNYLGTFYLDNNRVEEAKRNYKAFYEASENKERSCQALGDLLYQLRDYKGALELYRQMQTFEDKSTVFKLLNICGELRKESLYTECDELLQMIQERYTGDPDKVAGYKREMYHSGGRTGSDSSKYQNYMTKRLAIVGGVILALLGIFAGYNYYLMQNQPFYITNGLTQNAEVTIPGRRQFSVYANDTARKIIAEGEHTIEVTLEGRTPYTIDINVNNGLLNRLLNKNLFVINIKGARLLEYGKMLYSENQKEIESFDSENKLIVGQEFIVFRNIDYKFIMPPDEITVEGEKTSVVKSFVDTINPEDEIHALNILLSNLEYTDDDDILAYMRNIITFDDPTTDFVDAYDDVVNYLEEEKSKTE